jgi:hypothetical protein
LQTTDLRGIWAPAGLDVAHRRAATAKTVGREPEAQLLLYVSFPSPMIQAVVVDWWEAEVGPWI